MNINLVFALILLGPSTLVFAEYDVPSNDRQEFPTEILSPNFKELINTPEANTEALNQQKKSVLKKQQANPPSVKSPNSATDLVLVCEEMHEQRPLKRPPWSDFDRRQYEMTDERNKNVVRPYLAIKYLGGKLSFNSNGNNFLINETPEVPNSLGFVGRILIKEDTILMEYERLSGIRTTLKIDRHTGLYGSYSFHGDELLYEADGKCKKYSQKMF